MSFSEGLSNLSNKPLTVENKPLRSRGTVGRVYAIILNENTPSKEIFERFGGWDALGTVFYLDYSRREDIDQGDILEKINTNYFEVARPLDFNKKFYPLIGELIQLEDSPSPQTPLSKELHVKYYSQVLNYWNNSGNNADIVLSSNSLGKNFTSRDDIRHLMPFEGDYIIEGRNGNALRLSSTSKLNNNWWNTGIKDGDPITILSNGYDFNKNSLTPHLEDLNKDKAILCLTSTQTIPISFNKTDLNPLTKPIALNSYRGSQILLQADRVTLVSKNDNVMIGATGNIEMFTKNIINLDADDRIVHNSRYIFLGLNNGKLPTEPILLGGKSYTLISNLLEALGEFAVNLTTVISTPQGSPIIDITTSASSLYAKIERLMVDIEKIISKKVYIAN
jgi:hypothetical protein